MRCLIDTIYISVLSLNPQLHTTRSFFKRWHKLTTQVSTIPLKSELTADFIGKLFDLQKSEAAINLSISFAGLLRAIEVLSLKWGNTILPNGARLSYFALGTVALNIYDQRLIDSWENINFYHETVGERSKY